MKPWRYASCIIALSLSTAVWADDWQYSGQTTLLLNQTQYAADDTAASLGGMQGFSDATATARLMARKRWDNYEFNIHYQLGGTSGDSFALGSAASPFAANTLPNDSARLFNLTQVMEANKYGGWMQRLDRLNIGHTGDHLVWRVGRQAVSWGDGLVFQPMDIFNPFSPLAIDTSYKPGDDMLYSQWLFDSGDDLQFIYLPRRDTSTGALDPRQDSTALKYHTQTAWGGWDLLLARHYSEDLVALGHVQDLAGGVWRLDINQTHLHSGHNALFAVTNYDYSWTAFNHNFYGFIEYFFDSLGADNIDVTAIDPDLLARLRRGELFTLGRHELALGATMEISPLWQLNGLLMGNMGDGSAIMRLNTAYDWTQDTKLSFGLQGGFGARGSEYGGLASPSQPGSYLGLGTRLFVYIQQYY